jgi:DNA primase
LSFYQWMESAVATSHQSLSPEMEGYLLGRGISPNIINEMMLGQWTPPVTPCPSRDFHSFGECGELVSGFLSIPIRSPHGSIIGMDFRRNTERKTIFKYRTSCVDWVPTFVGCWPRDLYRIWDGADVCLVEGLFDMVVSKVVPPNTVVLATAGAHVSNNHIRFLQRFMRHGQRVWLCYDEDAVGIAQKIGWEDDAGKRHKGVPERMKRVGIDCRAVRYTGGKDPGEVWDKGGIEGLLKAFPHAFK